ncbi:hypothetical protein GUJ93_ZPchr0001g30085 [Zizania palustris]|uniref:Uncharacterized protein n=1 Tax=Zizania palustris TaxID=103762 RepID=A0A8J5UZX7_ZIZPA|nr:hypothetical protein GUJ93_ZPchr0001g30085 [Zizania palustris]
MVREAITAPAYAEHFQELVDWVEDHKAGRLRFVVINALPGGDGSWLASASLWPRLVAALDSDEQHVFKPVTAECLASRQQMLRELVSRLQFTLL